MLVIFFKPRIISRISVLTSIELSFYSINIITNSEVILVSKLRVERLETMREDLEGHASPFPSSAFCFI